MARREKVLNLRPLTDEQVRWLSALGAAMATSEVDGATVWWGSYFDIDPGKVDWSNPYASFEPHAYVQLYQRLKTAMAAAREDHDKIFEMMREGAWPPGQPTVVKRGVDPFKLPEWLEWWQAENAFRRGYQGAWDQGQLGTLQDEIKRIVTRDKTFHPSKMRTLAREWSADPAVSQFFNDLADAFEAGNAPAFGKLSQMMKTLEDYRDKVYVQFSPYYFPDRAHGSGFLGLRGSDDAEYDEPGEDDAFIEPCGPLGSQLCLRVGFGRSALRETFRGEDQWDDAMIAMRAWSEKHRYWPTLWFVDDHGGVRPVDYSAGAGVDIALDGARTRKRTRRKRKRAA